MKHLLGYQTILLVGSSGLLGKAFLEAFQGLPFCLLTPSRHELDFTDLKQVQAYAQTHAFDLILHCGAYTQVDLAESEPEQCQLVNTQGCKNLLSLGVPLITFSTDYVFDGIQKKYTEQAARSPLNVYGISKALAEEALEKAESPWWNLRTSWLYGTGGKNFVDTVVQKIKNNAPLAIVDDQIGRPTNAQDLAECVIEEFIKKVPPIGHYHLQGSGEPASWYDIAQTLQTFLETNVPIKRIKSQDLHLPAQRPSFSVLENTKLAVDLPDWKESLRRRVGEIV